MTVLLMIAALSLALVVSFGGPLDAVLARAVPVAIAWLAMLLAPAGAGGAAASTATHGRVVFVFAAVAAIGAVLYHRVVWPWLGGSIDENLYLVQAQLLAEGMRSFNKRCAVGIAPNEKRIKQHLDNSLMLVTALNPHIGYEKAAQISLKAYREDLSLELGVGNGDVGLPVRRILADHAAVFTDIKRLEATLEVRLGGTLGEVVRIETKLLDDGHVV